LPVERNESVRDALENCFDAGLGRFGLGTEMTFPVRSFAPNPG
jgi:hypothetical protein